MWICAAQHDSAVLFPIIAASDASYFAVLFALGFRLGDFTRNLQ